MQINTKTKGQISTFMWNKIAPFSPIFGFSFGYIAAGYFSAGRLVHPSYYGPQGWIMVFVLLLIMLSSIYSFRGIRKNENKE